MTKTGILRTAPANGIHIRLRPPLAANQPISPANMASPATPIVAKRRDGNESSNNATPNNANDATPRMGDSSAQERREPTPLGGGAGLGVSDGPSSASANAGSDRILGNGVGSNAIG